MKLFLLLLNFVVVSSYSAWAKPVKLAYGGKINLNELEWDVVDTKAMFENIPQSFVHKKHTDLKGWLMGGTPDSVAKCTKSNNDTFNVCTDSMNKDKKVFYQIILTRKIDKKVYQNYLISFSFSDSQKEKYDPLVKSFVGQLERFKR